ncbi:hypothetical protein HA49_05440 [Tatumella morbirosei]|uniref:Uncharacterized protein n=1 Tax=Tatumella morbirosei TaxID=642227 RepID=A0A095TCY0_9GAMM|nr:hypothetical protein HA49_05440 [Tatumella morbirosei]
MPVILTNPKIIPANSFTGDHELKHLPTFGAVDQFISSNQILAVPDYCQALSVIYKTPIY